MVPLEDGSDDAAEVFLDGVFERAFAAIARGIDVSVDDLLEGREALRRQVEDLVRVARDLAVEESDVLPRVPGYTILGELGRGGMGVVYLARQERLGGRLVALKILPASSALSPRARERFRQEVHAIAALRHPNVVAVHDVVDSPDVEAFAMEWVEGRSLAEIIESARRGDEPSAQPVAVCRIGLAIARALAAVHERGILHRDVKPSNVLVRKDGTPLLSDFGLARDADDASASGTFVGTLAYAAPEQIRGDRSLDGRADVYALGATLYHALTLRAPFEGKTTGAILRELDSGRVPAIRRSNPRLSVDLQTIVAKAMDPETSRRYASAAELADDLERLLDLQPIHARPAGFITRTGKLLRRNRRALAAALAASVLTLGLAAGFVVHRFVVPKWVKEHVDAARLALLSPHQGNAIFVQELIGSRAPDADQPALDEGAFSESLAAYDAALRLGPFDRSLARERDVVSLALGPGDSATLARVAEHAPAAAAFAEIGAPCDLSRASFEDLRLLGLLAFLRGEVDSALDAWSRLDRAADPDPFVLAALGKLLLVRNRPDQAYPRLQEAIEAFPTAGFLHVDLAEAALRCGDLAKAERLLDRARTLGRLDPLGGLDRVEAGLLAATGRTAEARVRYEDVCRRKGGRVAAIDFGRFLDSRGEWEAALGQFLIAVSQGLRCDEIVATADRWWASLPVEERYRRVRRTLDATAWPESIAPLLSAVAAQRGSTETNSAISPEIDAANVSPFLQRARLGDLGERMEVGDMSRWSRFLSYPSFLKDAQAAAWVSEDPAAGGRVVECLSSAFTWLSRRRGELLARGRRTLAPSVGALAVALAAAHASAQTMTYDAALGSLPQAQGWDVGDTGDSPAPFVAAGVLHQGPTSGDPARGYQFWTDDDLPMDFGQSVTLEFTLRIISSNDFYSVVDDAWKPGYSVYLFDTAGRQFAVGISSEAAFVSTDNLSKPEMFPRHSLPTTSGFHTYRLEIECDVATLYFDGAFVVSQPAGTYLTPSAANVIQFGDSAHQGTNESELMNLSYSSSVADYLDLRPGTVDTGAGGPPVDVMFVNGSAGDPVERRVTVAAGVTATLQIDKAPNTGGPRGGYGFWIFDGDLRGCEEIVFKKPAGARFSLGRANGCMPINNSIAPGECPCPLTIPRGLTSRRLTPAKASLFCLLKRAGDRSPVEHRLRLPAGTFTLLSLHQDRNSPSSPGKNIAIGNTIVIVSE